MSKTLPTLIVVDVEADGPYVPKYNMVCFGAVAVQDPIRTTFYGQTQPVSVFYDADALAISGFTRKEHEAFPDPRQVMLNFHNWLSQFKKPVFISDNPAFDWMWINSYLWIFTDSNPFGWSARRAGDLWCGMEKNMFAKWKQLRTTAHTHNPVDDAKGVAEALIEMSKRGLKGIL